MSITRPRLHSIDALKGLGIVAFIIWHCYELCTGYVSNYVIGRSSIFATGLFIALSGLMVGFHYNRKLEGGKQVAKVLSELLIRAGKLFVYVIVANLTVSLLKTKTLGFRIILMKIGSLFYFDRWDVTFQVLFVIAIGLLLNLALLIIAIKSRIIIPALIIVLLALFIFDFFYKGHIPYLWRYLPLSVTGTFVGLFFVNLQKEKTRKGLLFLTLLTFLSLWLASVIWERTYTRRGYYSPELRLR
jgi:hypothetical protein